MSHRNSVYQVFFWGGMGVFQMKVGKPANYSLFICHPRAKGINLFCYTRRFKIRCQLEANFRFCEKICLLIVQLAQNEICTILLILYHDFCILFLNFQFAINYRNFRKLFKYRFWELACTPAFAQNAEFVLKNCLTQVKNGYAKYAVIAQRFLHSARMNELGQGIL